jgi:hypothetical protein
MKDRLGTIWKDTYDLTPIRNLSFEELKNTIISGEIGNVKEKFYYIKKYKSEGIMQSVINDYKASLPVVNMVGTYTQRSNSSINVNSFNWIISWDIDKKENKSSNFEYLWEMLKNDESVILCARTSGGGIRGFSKLLVNAFDFNIYDYQPTMKNVVHPYLQMKWNVALDWHQYTLSQPWYMPYDPEVYFNWDARPIINVSYNWKPKKIYHTPKPNWMNFSLQEEYYNALKTVDSNSAHYTDVLKLLTYGKSINCDYGTLLSILEDKFDDSSSISKMSSYALNRMYEKLNIDRCSKNGARKIIGSLGGDKTKMRYEK